MSSNYERILKLKNDKIADLERRLAEAEEDSARVRTAIQPLLEAAQVPILRKICADDANIARPCGIGTDRQWMALADAIDAARKEKV